MERDYTPDALNHLRLSLIKSGFRVAAGSAMVMAMFVDVQVPVVIGGVLLILAELLGVAEELV